ncbi:MAG: hypothetical protein L3J39_08790 [Verrucomicrobiales bacterium]|nr:hypothetical protein [Verrucomicrobiales bacterium]
MSFLIAPSAQAQNIYLDEGESEKQATSFILPYVYASEQLGAVLGVGGVSNGYLQPQATAGGAVQGTSNGSYGLYLGGINYQMPFAKRWFFDPFLAVSRYTEMRSYQDVSLQFGDARAGSNGSDEDDYIEGKGWDVFMELRTKWLLPIGHGKNDILHTYHVRNGLLPDDKDITGGEAFNPFTSGRTFITFTPFYRSQEYDKDVNDILLSSSNGIQAGLLWNNKDFEASPSRGEEIEFIARRDFGLFNSDDSWTTWEFEASKYFSLGKSDWARQQVLALNFWTADTPSWNNNNGEISNRAPDFYSPKLGGFTRMRAFPFERFNDRSSIYYSAEYRVIPEWNPWAEIAWLDNWLAIDWWQIVPFAELGRVAPSYDLGALHEDMKWDAGIGLRFMAKKSVIRIDWAASEESTGLWFMFGQTF